MGCGDTAVLPDTCKVWAFEQWVYGTCWLDRYRLTGDPRWRDAGHPRISFGWNRDAQLRLARACARLAQRTGSALWKAKAEALAGAMLTARFPTTGQIPHVPDVDVTSRYSFIQYCGPGSGEGGNRGEYATMALIDLAELWEPARR